MKTSQLSEQPKPPQDKPKKPKSISAKEWRRLLALHCFEDQVRQEGFHWIAGIDEAGRGPLAGPVVAAACLIPPGIFFKGVDDSKKLTPQKRAELFACIKENPHVQFGVGIVDSVEIDRINIYQATIKAMFQAVDQLVQKPDILFIDGREVKHPHYPTKSIIGGDAKSHSIATASVIAKVTRDAIMVEHHKQWPQYGFNEHKGYSTEQHLHALEKYGPCAIHRRSFDPVRILIGVQNQLELF
jgi:ribonuclease HII